MLQKIVNFYESKKASILPAVKKTWGVSQAYELKHAIGFMQEPHFGALFKDHISGKLNVSTGYKDTIILNEFFAGENQDVEWKKFLEHISGKICVDIGPCVYSPLATWDVAGKRIAIEPLFEPIDRWQKQHLGRSVFENLTCYSTGADEFIPELFNKIDGAIYCRNMLDHTPNWAFVLSNIASYAIPGCKLLLWNDIDHRGTADEGHYDITSDPKAFRRMIEQFGFKIIRDFQVHDRAELNYGCYAVKS